MPPARTVAEQQKQDKLTNSYNSLLAEFNSPDLHSVGNYSLGRLIGKGSFGKVYLASHKLIHGSRVVLKSANKNDANLAREIHHHRQFLHPHIARLYEVIVTENLVWLVLEYCPGDELYNHLLEKGKMDAGTVQKIFTQLVGAVSYVHNKACVHRDLKLENILLDKNDNVKLVDFGFTREYQGATSYLQTWCGTICYSAPEMLKGEKYAGEKVDVWSLGVILYALLCGELPFDEDDESDTKNLILKQEPKYPDHVPEPARDLIKKLLSKRPLLRPSLADILRDPWLTEHAPQQQEILKLQQPPPFTTPLEKDVLQRMRSAGVDIDMVIEHVLAQRCDSLAGWWALLLEKEERKEKRRQRKRKEKEAEAKSLRRLSAASSRLLAQSALGEIYEGEEGATSESPRTRGRRMTRQNGSATVSADLPRVTETKSPEPEDSRPPPIEKDSFGNKSRSRSRPKPPPKEPSATTVRRPRNTSRGSSSMLRTFTTNPDLLSPNYVPPTQRAKRRTFYQQPLKQQLSMVKHWFKENAKRAKSPVAGTSGTNSNNNDDTSPKQPNGQNLTGHGSGGREIKRTSTGPLPQHRKASFSGRPDIVTRATLPARPRLDTTSSHDSNASLHRAKRASLSPNTLTPHSSYRRRSSTGRRGVSGRKSASSSVSSIRSMHQGPGGGNNNGTLSRSGSGTHAQHPTHNHSLSKASSTSSNSLSMASPSALSGSSTSRVARSPHTSVKVLPSTPTTGSFPSGIRISRRPVPGSLGSLPTFNSEARSAFASGGAPPSPGLPVFARRKRSVFRGPGIGGSPSGLGRLREGSSGSREASRGRKSGDLMGEVVEEDEEMEEGEGEDGEYEDVVEDVEPTFLFGPELDVVSPAVGMPGEAGVPATPLEGSSSLGGAGGAEEGLERGHSSAGAVPLTAKALAKKNIEDRKIKDEKMERYTVRAS